MKLIFLRLNSLILLLVMLFSLVPDFAAAETEQIDFSTYIVQNHPRLYVTSFEGLKKKYLSEPTTAKWYNALLAEAEVISDGSVMEYDTEALALQRGNVRVIDSQTVLDRFYCLAFAAAVEESRSLANRLWLEIDAAINLETWNPSHWLEVAEMMHSVAIAYDWCYDFWTNEQKLLMKNAILNLGLNPAIREYNGNPEHNEWMKGLTGAELGTNWAIVCNTGVLMGALSVYEKEDEKVKTLCNDMIYNAIRSMKSGTNAYASDGAWSETLNYWEYATTNLIMATDAFESAIGDDFNNLPPIKSPFTYDFSLAPGIRVTPDFPIYGNGPAGVFNYGDASGGYSVSSPSLMWIGKRFNIPHYTDYHINNLAKKGMGDENIPLNLLWYGGGEKKKTLSEDRLFENDFASMRSSWNDDEAIFVTLKGGTNGRPHQHYDIGTFVFDAFGTRFGRTLGAIKYGGPNRKTVYKGRTEGQNTVVINPDETAGQCTSAGSEFESFYSGNASAYAILNMTDAYSKRSLVTFNEEGREVSSYDEPTSVTSARRGVKMYSDKTRIVVQDEFKMNKPSEYYWFMHTTADIKLYNNYRSAIIIKDGKSVYMNVISSDGDAKFEIMDAKPFSTSPNSDAQVPDSVKKLTIHLENVTEAAVAVEIIPSLGTEPVYSDYITPLDEWHPENDVTRFGRELTIYGDDKPGRTATMLVKSPLGYVYGIGQEIVDSKGEFVLNACLPKNYENGIYSVYLNGSLYKTFEVTDGIDAGVASASFSLSYDLPEWVNSSVLVAAEYENGCMVQITSAEYNKATSSATVNFEFNPSKGNTLKFFYLDNLKDITPLYSAKEIIVQ